MSIEKIAIDDIARPPSDDYNADVKSLDDDALHLAQMGYSQELKRNYTWISLFGVGFTLTNSWWGISAALITGINSGGPVQIVYGLILLALISTCTSIPLFRRLSDRLHCSLQFLLSFRFGLASLRLAFELPS